MSAPTLQTVALRLLRYNGVTQLAAQTGMAEVTTLQAYDLDDVCQAVNGGMQELWDLGPAEMKERNVGYVLRPPFETTVTVTQFSNAFTALAGYASWMKGCTIRISGDDQDNEIGTLVTGAGTLATPYMGTTGTVSATVFGDCVELDGTIGKIYAPVVIPNQFPLHACATREEFTKFVGAPTVTGSTGAGFPFSPFFAFYRKTIARPLAWFVEARYDAANGALARRIRIGPMPNTQYPLGFRAGINPPQFIVSDIAGASPTYTDPGTVIPIPNGWVESILIPFALQRYSALPTFKNEQTKAEIARQYKVAQGILANSRGQSSLNDAVYI